MRLTLLHNPAAGDAGHDGDELESLLREAGHVVAYQSLKEDGWKDVLDDAIDLIVIAGGDGSVRKVFTAIGRSSTVALILPVGSANNIARTLGLDYESALGLLVGGEPRARRSFDVWNVTSTWGSSRCVEAVGGGLFAEVLAEADDSAADPSGPAKVNFGLELLAETLRAATPRRWTLEIDGTRVEQELIGVEAMNIHEIGANICLAGESDPGDGVLDVVLVGPDDRDELAAYVAARLQKDDAEAPRLTAHQGRHIVIEPPGEAPIHVDDVLPGWDLGTTTWVELSSADVSIEVVVPREPDQRDPV